MTTTPEAPVVGVTYSIVIHRPRDLETDAHVSLITQRWTAGAPTSIPELTSREWIPDVEIRSAIERILNSLGVPSLQEEIPF